MGVRPDAAFPPPVILAKRLATLDRLSGGRVVAGLGHGWMPEELTITVGCPAERGVRFEEHLIVMRACWATDRSSTPASTPRSCGPLSDPNRRPAASRF